MSMWLLCKIFFLMRPFLQSHHLNDMQMREAFPSIHTVQITVILQMLVFRKPLKKQIRPLPSVQLGHIINMGLLSDRSKN